MTYSITGNVENTPQKEGADVKEKPKGTNIHYKRILKTHQTFILPGLYSNFKKHRHEKKNWESTRNCLMPIK